MSWQGTDWQYDPDISEIAIPINITDNYVFNIEDVYTVFHNGDVTTMYLCTPVMDIPVLGAFAYTTDIISIEIPISVISIGDFSFYRSNLQVAKISPFLNYTDGTFPQLTFIIYWDITDLSCVLTKTEYEVGEAFDYSTCTVTVTAYDGTEYETGVVTDYEVVDFDTSQAGEIPLKIKYNGTIYTTDQTISIVLYPDVFNKDITTILYQNNTIDESTGQIGGSTTSKICSSESIQIPKSKYKYIMLNGLLQNTNALNSEIFFYDENNTYLGYKSWYPNSSNIVYAPIPDNTKSFKILLNSFSNEDFTSSDLSSVTVTFAISANDILLTNYTWTQNTGNDSTGAMDTYANNRIACQNYISIPTGSRKISITASTTSNVSCKNFGYWYTNSSYITYWDWVSSGTQVNINSSATRLRIGLCRNDNAPITPSDLSYCIIRFT